MNVSATASARRTTTPIGGNPPSSISAATASPHASATSAIHVTGSPYWSATSTAAPLMHDATRSASTVYERGATGGTGFHSTCARPAVNTAHNGVSVTHENASTLQVSSHWASSRIATPPAAPAARHTVIARAVRGSQTLI